jgi:hypothetical protein
MLKNTLVTFDLRLVSMMLFMKPPEFNIQCNWVFSASVEDDI